MSQKNGKASKTVNFTFQLTAEPKSPYWALLKYYQQQSKEKARQLIIEAASGYWEASAYSWLASGEDLFQQRLAADNCIYQLMQQINFVQSQFKLNELKGKIEAIESLEWEGDRAVEFDFRYQVRAAEQGGLIQYLMHSETMFSLEQKVLWSSLAYWGAIAERELGLLPLERLKWSAANCIYRLRQHIDYLDRYFDLNRAIGLGASAVPQPAPVKLKSSRRLNGGGRTSPNPTKASHQSPCTSPDAEGGEEGNGRDEFLGDPENDELVMNSLKNL